MTPIGCGQITWRGVPETEVLDDIASAGYEGAPPKLGVGRSATETLDLYGRHGLRPAPCYFSAQLWHQDLADEIVDNARRAAQFVRELGLTEMYVAPGGEYVARSGRTRRQAAAHVEVDDGLTDEEFRAAAAVLEAVGGTSLEEGVHSCFHNHVGTVIESEEEIERLLRLTDPERVFLGPDTGHLAWAGVDVADFCRRHAGRIRTMHLKDIDGGVRRRGIAAGWDYDAFAERGIFAELGEGCVDLPAALQLLDGAGFSGWLIVETDVTRKPTALESARISRAYLRSVGR